jgi:hypothetical protein
MYCFFKKQHHILNKINEKTPIKSLIFRRFSHESNANANKNVMVGMYNKLKKMIIKRFEENDEILELLYMGRIRVQNCKEEMTSQR